MAVFAQHDAVSSISAAVMLTDGYPLVAGWEDAELEGQYFIAFKLDPSDGTVLWKWQVHAPVGDVRGDDAFASRWCPCLLVFVARSQYTIIIPSNHPANLFVNHVSAAGWLLTLHVQWPRL